MAIDEGVAISIRGVSKSFKIPLDGNTSIKQKILNIFKHKRGYRQFTPLNNVTFDIKQGEFFGVVGRNGSGKSTLLKTIAGIYVPNKGRVKVNGLLVPFIELGVGFNPELSGRENVYLNAALLGFSRKETARLYEEIVDFAELHDFMEEKLKNYSSGMQVRLAFSIAIQAKGDILLLDEVLAVGDSAFQQKCYNYFEQLKREKKTVVLVSHNMAAVERFCDRAALIEKGEVVFVGDSADAALHYKTLFLKDPTRTDSLVIKGDKDAFEVTAAIKQNGKLVSGFTKPKEDIEFDIDIYSKYDVGDVNLVLVVKNEDRKTVAASSTRDIGGKTKLSAGKKKTVRLHLENRFTNGEYSVDLGINSFDAKTKKNITLVYRVNELTRFTIAGITKHTDSLFHPKVTIEEE